MELTEHDKEILQAVIDGREIEYKHKSGDWLNSSHVSALGLITVSEGHLLRIKPETIMIGDMEVPRPLSVEPGMGEEVYLVDPTRLRYGIPFTWEGLHSHYRRLKWGLLQATHDGMIQHATALIKVSGGSL